MIVEWSFARLALKRRWADNTPPLLPQAAPAMALQAGESKVVTEYTLFHEVTVGDYSQPRRR